VSASSLDQALLESYLRESGETPRLGTEEEARLIRQVVEGDGDAGRRLARANLDLVLTVARRYLDRGLGVKAVIDVGNFGLIRAARRYDPSHGFAFRTYATWWVRQSIVRALADHQRSTQE
jgi:RNA polymerase primary sigma factor